MKKKFLIIQFVILAILLVIGLCFYTKKDTSIKMSAKITNEQWALKNSGQKIKSKKGIKGIDINISKAWEITTGNPNILVAVVDSGVDISCSGLADSISDNGKDFYYNDNTVFDDYTQDYHGTYIANTIAGFDSKNKVYGVAPNIKILPVKFLRGTLGNSTDAVKAVKYACENGAKVVNCSWNFNDYNEELFKVIASYPDVLFVCAAGNSNCNLDSSKIYPACYNLNNILTVMAVDNCGDIYESSGRGMSVDIAAPGANIKTTFPEDDVSYVSGTSVATAYVSGVTALMLSENNKLTPPEIIDIVVSTAKKIDTLDKYCLSGGIIDAYKCVKSSVDKNK